MVIARIKPAEVNTLSEVLAQIDADVENNPLVPFMRMPSLHFARFAILDAATDIHGNPIPPSLAFSTDFDLPLDRTRCEHGYDQLLQPSSRLDCWAVVGVGFIHRDT